MQRSAAWNVLLWLTIGVSVLAVTLGGPGSSGRITSSGVSTEGVEVLPGDVVTFTCLNSTIYLSGTSYCHDQTRQLDICDSTTCPYSLTVAMDSGFPFKYWGVSGTSCIGTSPGCLSSSKSETQSWYAAAPNPSSHYSGTLDVNGYVGPEYGSNCQGAPSVSGVTASVQNGFEQAWVNWSDSNGFLSSFQWGTSLSYGSPDPWFISATGGGHGDVHLNAISQGTTYYYQIVDMNNCGVLTSAYQASFSTTSASSSSFVGWVFSFSANQYEYDPTGATISGATVGAWATCPYFFLAGIQAVYGGSFSTEFTTSTDTTGYYALGFPSVATPTWDGFVQHLTLSSTGQCSNRDISNVDSNSAYTLEASEWKHFNNTVGVSSSLSSANDYRKFILPNDTWGYVPLGIVYMHTRYAGADIDYQVASSTYSETVYSYLRQTASYAQQNSGSGDDTGMIWPAGFGGTVELALEYNFSGNVTYSGGRFSEADAALAAAPKPIATVALTSLTSASGDWDNSPPSSGYVDKVVSSSENSNTTYYTYDVFGGGTWSASSGWDIQVSLGLGAYGTSGSLNLGYQETSTVLGSGNYYIHLGLKFNGTDPHGGEDQFYILEDSASGQVAPSLHVWEIGYCGGSGEPACG